MPLLIGAFTSLLKLLYNTRYCTLSYRQVSSNSRYFVTILEHLTYCRPNSIMDMTTLLHNAVSLVKMYVEFRKKTPKQRKAFELNDDIKCSRLRAMITVQLHNRRALCKVISSFEEVLYVILSNILGTMWDVIQEEKFISKIDSRLQLAGYCT